MCELGRVRVFHMDGQQRNGATETASCKAGSRLLTSLRPWSSNRNRPSSSRLQVDLLDTLPGPCPMGTVMGIAISRELGRLLHTSARAIAIWSRLKVSRTLTMRHRREKERWTPSAHWGGGG